MSGADLARRLYDGYLAAVVDVPHAAAFLGWGSDVLGYDDERSQDHGFGRGVDARLAAHAAAAAARGDGGPVFADDGRLAPVRAELAWYPDDVWFWILAAQWRRIAQEESFAGRAAERADELGFLLERRHAPYSKWFGTAFAATPPEVGPPLEAALAATAGREREDALVPAYEAVARRQVALTPGPEPQVCPYFSRPFRVIGGGSRKPVSSEWPARGSARSRSSPRARRALPGRLRGVAKGPPPGRAPRDPDESPSSRSSACEVRRDDGRPARALERPREHADPHSGERRPQEVRAMLRAREPGRDDAVGRAAGAGPPGEVLAGETSRHVELQHPAPEGAVPERTGGEHVARVCARRPLEVRVHVQAAEAVLHANPVHVDEQRPLVVRDPRGGGRRDQEERCEAERDEPLEHYVKLG